MKIAVSAGHHPDDPGACNGERCEYADVLPIVAEVIRYLQHHGHDAYLVGTGYLTDKIKDIKALNPDCCIEIHFNGAAVEATGCETLYYPGSAVGKPLAESIQKLLPFATRNRDRGVKPGYYYEDGERAGKLAFLEIPGIPAVIVEPLFIQNEPELLDNQWAMQKIGIAIAKGIMAWEG